MVWAWVQLSARLPCSAPCEGSLRVASPSWLWHVNLLQSAVVSASTAGLRLQVDLVLLPAVTGDFGVMPGHVPTVAQLRPGVVTIHKELDKEVEKLFVSSGFAFVHPDSSADVCAVEAVKVDELDPEAVRAGLQVGTPCSWRLPCEIRFCTWVCICLVASAAHDKVTSCALKGMPTSGQTTGQHDMPLAVSIASILWL